MNNDQLEIKYSIRISICIQNMLYNQNNYIYKIFSKSPILYLIILIIFLNIF